MTFGQPLWFWAFALFPIALALFFRNEALRAKLLRQLVAARLADRLAGTVSVGKRRARFALLLLGMGAIIVSLAQPRAGDTWEQSKRKGRDVLIAIDVSKSMLATDLTPSRLTRAKFAAQDLISQLGGDRVGLIAFAGGAFSQAPLTADYGAVLNSLNELDTDIIPLGGTNIAEAIRVANDAFGKGESEHRALIVFTDGEEIDFDGIKAAEKLNGVVKIFGVGVGTADGSLIPLPGKSGGTDFVRDDNDQFVKSRLDETRLRKIAESTGGFYVHLQSGPAEMTQIVRDGLGKMSEKEIDEKMSRKPIERYQWPLAAGLVLLAFSMLIGERRRGAGIAGSRATAALAMLLAFATAGAAAESPLDLYSQGKYDEAQRAWQQLAEKNPKSDVFAFNWGAAAYKNKDLDTALKAFGQALTTEDAGLRAKTEYNLGNTLFQKGAAKMDRKTLEDALAHYVQALHLAPHDPNAEHNKKVTEELLEKLKQQQQQQQKQDQKKQDQKDQQQQKQDQQKNDSKDQQDQKKEQQKSDEQDAQKQQGAQQKEQSKADKDQQQQQQSQGAGEKKDEQQSKPQDSKQSESQQGEKKEQQQQQDGQKEAKNDGAQGEKPEPAQEQPEKKLSGELKANPSQPQEQKDAQEEAAAEQLAAIEGKMTERQAKALLDSLKGEDDRVRLVDPNERKHAGRVLHDW
ncbi:MAG TPA: VWA domain-containing protein [Chthoniobacteraceae bacterium]|nr:VWA domain-containing protein [Chthoniobacteraceae bacterium]